MNYRCFRKIVIIYKPLKFHQWKFTDLLKSVLVLLWGQTHAARASRERCSARWIHWKKEQNSHYFGVLNLYSQLVTDKTMHYTCKNSALAVSIGHFVPYISDRLVAPGRNITMASQARQLLLDSEDIMDSYCNDSDSEYESEHSDIESENETVHVRT